VCAAHEYLRDIVAGSEKKENHGGSRHGCSRSQQKRGIKTGTILLQYEDINEVPYQQVKKEE